MAPDSRPAWTWPLHPASWPRRISDLSWPGAKVGGALLAFGGLVLGSAGTVAVASLHWPPATAGRASAGTVPGSSAYGLISRAAPPSDSARAVPHEAAAPPTSVVIPRLGIRSRLLGLRLTPDGSVQVPVDYGTAGWYRDGPAPGDVGAAVILGHVDSTTGPAIFYRLRELRRTDVVFVNRADGTTVRFTVDRSADYPKARFPSAAVYASTGRLELRLITCTGAFARGHYRDNLVVFAHEPLRRAAAKPATKANPTMTAATRPAGKPAAEKRAAVHQPSPVPARFPVGASKPR